MPPTPTPQGSPGVFSALVGANVGIAQSTQVVSGLGDVVDAVRDVETAVLTTVGSAIAAVNRGFGTILSLLNTASSSSSNQPIPIPGTSGQQPGNPIGVVNLSARMVNVVSGGTARGISSTSSSSSGRDRETSWQDIVKFGVRLAAVAGISVSLVGAFKALTVGALGLTDQFKEMSPQMARVAAERDIRELMRGMHVGNLLALGQRRLVDAQQDFKDALAPLQIKLAEILQVLNTEVLRYAADFTKNFGIGLDAVQHYLERILADPGILLDADKLGKAMGEAQKQAMEDFRRKMVPVVAAIPWTDLIIRMADFNDGLQRRAVP